MKRTISLAAAGLVAGWAPASAGDLIEGSLRSPEGAFSLGVSAVYIDQDITNGLGMVDNGGFVFLQNVEDGARLDDIGARTALDFLSNTRILDRPGFVFGHVGILNAEGQEKYTGISRVIDLLPIDGSLSPGGLMAAPMTLTSQ